MPRILTGLARQSRRTADLIMVGIAVGPAGIAGLTFVAPFWSVAGGIGSGLTNGAIGIISQRYGAGEYRQMDVAIKQTIWLSLLIVAPVVVIYTVFAEELISLLGNDATAIGYGAQYLRILSVALVFTYLNKVAIRTLLSADDSRIEMIIRVTAGLINIVLNLIFIFGFGMGVVGAALGTVISEIVVTVSFTYGFATGRHPGIGEFPVQLSRHPHVDAALLRNLVVVSAPLIVRRTAKRAARFPLLAIVAQFGTAVVAGYGIGRRAFSLIRTPNWGFSLAASSLVGQELGTDNEPEAEAYGWDILRYSTAIYLLVAAAVVVFARPIAFAFTQDPTVIDAAVPFIRIVAFTNILYGVDGVATGILRGGSDTRWPLYGRFVGIYFVTLPVAYLAITTPLGLIAVYLSLLTETLVPAAVTFYRFTTGKWKIVSREYRPGTSD